MLTKAKEIDSLPASTQKTAIMRIVFSHPRHDVRIVFSHPHDVSVTHGWGVTRVDITAEATSREELEVQQVREQLMVEARRKGLKNPATVRAWAEGWHEPSKSVYIRRFTVH